MREIREEEKENKRETKEGWLVAIIEEKKERVQSVCRLASHEYENSFPKRTHR